MGGPNSGRRPNPALHTPEEMGKWREEKVVHLSKHPRLDVVPDPDLPLGKDGLLKYREVAETLLKSDQLTIITKAMAETLAMTFEEIQKRMSEGRSVSANLIQRYQSANGQLQLLDTGRAAAGTQGPKQNRFRYSGFASRLR